MRRLVAVLLSGMLGVGIMLGPGVGAAWAAISNPTIADVYGLVSTTREDVIRAMDAANSAANLASSARGWSEAAYNQAKAAEVQASMAKDQAAWARDDISGVWLRADAARIAAKDAHDRADLAQKTAELARQAAQGSYDRADMAQKTAELARQSAEAARIAAKDGHDRADIAQKTAELARVAAQAGHDRADMAQKTAELARQAGVDAVGAAGAARDAATAGKAAAERTLTAVSQGVDDLAGRIGQTGVQIGGVGVELAKLIGMVRDARQAEDAAISSVQAEVEAIRALLESQPGGGGGGSSDQMDALIGIAGVVQDMVERASGQQCADPTMIIADPTKAPRFCSPTQDSAQKNSDEISSSVEGVRDAVRDAEAARAQDAQADREQQARDVQAAESAQRAATDRLVEAVQRTTDAVKEGQRQLDGLIAGVRGDIARVIAGLEDVSRAIRGLPAAPGGPGDGGGGGVGPVTPGRDFGGPLVKIERWKQSMGCVAASVEALAGGEGCDYGVSDRSVPLVLGVEFAPFEQCYVLDAWKPGKELVGWLTILGSIMAMFRFIAAGLSYSPGGGTV